jgi:hypothetical protein
MNKVLGVEVQLSPSNSIEFGQEDSNTMAHLLLIE